ncbi:gmp synthase [Echria macrotheca]|uniref:Gmp synthase n=1 Tax=Echria macrotheca TaxID=438768 RepID=A0AAJ0F5Z3_9PEZI|nr:gmp synthase [Echria macrotheca]
MSGYKDILKKGWHPEKEGTSLKGQMKSLVGRGDKNDKSNHVARPLSSLQDPSSFGPPPVRHVRTGSSGTPSPPISRPSSTATSNPSAAHHPPQAEDDPPPAPPRPYLPPPPVRRDLTNPPAISSLSISTPAGPTPPKLPPRLPPRNPASPSVTANNIPPTTTRPNSTGLLNQGAISRLTSAGISIPSFGIGSKNSTSPNPPPQSTRQPAPPPPSFPSSSTPPLLPARPSSTPSPTVPDSAATSSNLASRLSSRFGTSSSSTPSPAVPDSQSTGPNLASRLSSRFGNSTAPDTPQQGQQGGGTTFAQKRAALQTAAALRENPRSVSFGDARAAASTANNFRQRHGEQVAAGVRGAERLNEKLGGRFGNNGNGNGEVTSGDGGGGGGNSGGIQGVALGATAVLGGGGKKKAPPPPPPRKPRELKGEAHEPPPVPMGTRPQF